MYLGILSDIHEDIRSLCKALDFLQDCDKLICLGDIVGYRNDYMSGKNPRDAKECIYLIKEHCDFIVSGNHDLFSSKTIPEYNAGIDYPENWYSLSIKERDIIAKSKIWLYDNEEPQNIADKERLFLKNLASILKPEISGKKLLLSHYLYPDIHGNLSSFVNAYREGRQHIGFMKKNSCILGLCGHAHPEGFIIIKEKSLKKYSFSKTRLSYEAQAIVLPAITKGKKANGLSILDMDTFILECIPLQKI